MNKCLALALIFVVQMATAQDMGPQRDILIEKLDKVYSNLAPEEASRASVGLRLADLYSERARIAAAKELGQGCIQCSAGVKDREHAISIYAELLNSIPEAAKAKVLVQLGHLYELQGNEAKAAPLYEKIIAESTSTAEMKAEANLSLAEMNFRHHKYDLAKNYFSKVVESPVAKSKGLASYRIAWCNFHKSNVQTAKDELVAILQKPEMLSRGNLNQIDKQFQEEVSRDLATFMGRLSVSISDVEALYTLSPDTTRIANVAYLAAELERLGQLKNSLAAWQFVFSKQSQPQDRLESQIHIADMQFKSGDKISALASYEKAVDLWTRTPSCNAGQCTELKARIKNFLVDWNTNEKKAPSKELASAYASYVKVFSQEVDVLLWAAEVEVTLQNYKLAAQYAQQAGKAAGDKQGDKQEVALLKSVEIAELSKDKELLDSSYLFYLANSKERKRATEVQYQQAHLLYERGQYKEAAEALHQFAIAPGDTSSKTLKKQAADLALDSLVLAKQEGQIVVWAQEFSKIFVADAADFKDVQRKASLNKSATLVKEGARAVDLESAWAALALFEVSGAKDSDLAAYYKNKLVLAEKMNKFAEAREAADHLLALKNIALADQQYALSRKAWLSEMILDFDGALVATQKLSDKEMDKSARLLKLALYADLAEKDARPFYTEYLKASTDDEKKSAIAAQIVRVSNNPLVEIEKQKTYLSKKPELLAELYFEIYAATPSEKVLKAAFANSAIAGQPYGKQLKKFEIIEEYLKLKEKMTAHQIVSATQSKLAASLKARVQLLEQSEKLGAKAVTNGDWTSQVLLLSLIAAENNRFYQEVLSLPLPQGLTAEQEQEYLQLLSQQAGPHQIKAQDVQKKVDEFWASESAVSALSESATKSRALYANLVRKELQAVQAVAPQNLSTKLSAIHVAEVKSKELPSLKEVEAAKQAVRENPTSGQSLENLKLIEEKLGKEKMVDYLKARINSMQSSAQSNARSL